MKRSEINAALRELEAMAAMASFGLIIRHRMKSWIKWETSMCMWTGGNWWFPRVHR